MCSKGNRITRKYRDFYSICIIIQFEKGLDIRWADPGTLLCLFSPYLYYPPQPLASLFQICVFLPLQQWQSANDVSSVYYFIQPLTSNSFVLSLFIVFLWANTMISWASAKYVGSLAIPYFVAYVYVLASLWLENTMMLYQRRSRRIQRVQCTLQRFEIFEIRKTLFLFCWKNEKKQLHPPEKVSGYGAVPNSLGNEYTQGVNNWIWHFYGLYMTL